MSMLTSLRAPLAASARPTATAGGRRLFYVCAAYNLIHSLRENMLCHTELAQAQPMSIILKLFQLAVRVVQ